MSGTLHTETGTVTFDDKPMNGLAPHQRTHLGIARSFQLPRPFHTLTVAENIRVPLLYTVRRRRDVAHTKSSWTIAATKCLDLVSLKHKAE